MQRNSFFLGMHFIVVFALIKSVEVVFISDVCNGTTVCKTVSQEVMRCCFIFADRLTSRLSLKRFVRC